MLFALTITVRSTFNQLFAFVCIVPFLEKERDLKERDTKVIVFLCIFNPTNQSNVVEIYIYQTEAIAICNEELIQNKTYSSIK